ncbi:MAG TPA: hypothetical protein VFI42_19930, partial [Thermomicrobiaceae bacterium]|nr:hypothetical protein [Thermomicrobiaceae bacterium]
MAFAAAWLAAIVMVAVQMSGVRIGVDAHAYWAVWHLGLYGPRMAFGGPDAFLYSPAFAAAIWPLTLLSWPAFAAAWTALALGTYAWLLWPLELPVRVPLLIASGAVAATGNIEWLIALALVASARWPSAWAVPLLTKVSFGVGVVWYAARGEWR